MVPQEGYGKTFGLTAIASIFHLTYYILIGTIGKLYLYNYAFL